MKLQLHTSTSQKVLSRGGFIPIKNWLHIKPIGGLWVSTFINKKFGSSWIQWCLDEKYSEPVQYGYLIKIRDNARVLLIDSQEDYFKVKKKYPYKYKGTNKELGKAYGHMIPFDWEAIAKDFDVISLTSKGERETRFMFFTEALDMGLYGWDCESSLITNFDAIESVKEIGLLKFKQNI